MEHNLGRLVAEVISRLAPRLGANGRRGRLVVALCGATSRFNEAISQIRALVLDGYRMELVFSAAAEELYGKVFREQLAGFPHIDSLRGAGWLGALGEAEALLIPLLSVNTLSKVSMLMADNLVTNLFLHALFMGKTVVAARNGADPDETARKALGFQRGSPALRNALIERFHVLNTYGCVFTDVDELRDTLNAILANRRRKPEVDGRTLRKEDAPVKACRKVLSAADVLRAHRSGADVTLSPLSVVTPLAREMARRYGVSLNENE